MIFTFLREDVFASNTHVYTDGKYAVVIDPSSSLADIIRKEPTLGGVKFEKCLLTHTHIDHFLEIQSYKQAGIEIVVPESDAAFLSDIFYNCAFMLRSNTLGYDGEYTAVSDNEIIKTSLGDIRVISTPGHTKGSVCYSFGDALFSGDTVFEGGGYGRCDLPGGNQRELLESLRKLKTQNQEIKVYSGHGGSFTLGESLDYLDI